MTIDVPEQLRRLGPAVLLRWPLRTKGDKRKWKHLRQHHMTEPYLENLATGNIGVALGEVSDELIVVDADDEQLNREFDHYNPKLRTTLRTRGSRGGAWWLRMAGPYPGKTVKLKGARGGMDLGEFRSNGSQSIVAGIHPCGQPYRRLVDAPVLTVPFSIIIWPASVANPPMLTKGDQELTKRIQEVEVGRESWFPLDSLGSPWLTECVVRNKRTSHAQLLKLARVCLGIEIKAGRKLTDTERKAVFADWHRQSLPFLRLEQSRSEYWLEFLECTRCARVPLDGNSSIQRAWELSKHTVPDVALQYDGPIRRLVAFARHLQGDRPSFFLGTKTIANLFQVKPMVGWRWMRGLCDDSVLELLKVGVRPHASEYRFIAT